VHRSRLFAQHLPQFGWDPIILTVHQDYYEEKLDYNLQKLLPDNLRIEKTSAFKVTKPRAVGDIGLRGFYQMYKKAKQIIKNEKIDFLYIPIPSFYAALLGRWLHETTGIKYGIDYIDPWVHQFPGSDRLFSRHWFSTAIAKILEPIAVKKASLITGVAEGYYKGVQERNPHLINKAVFGAMPYGGEKSDHAKIKHLNIAPYLFTKKANVFQLVYAGAMLPKAYEPLERIFKAITSGAEHLPPIEFHFIGTGKSPDDPNGYNIKPLAKKYGLWQTRVFEYPKRIPYLDVLIHLDLADGVFILGSTEPHYTPSKVYQGVLSNKPILAVLHQQSSAVTVLKQSGAGLVLPFDGTAGLEDIERNFLQLLFTYLEWTRRFNPASINNSAFEAYSARGITEHLARLLNKSIENGEVLNKNSRVAIAV
jgi:hypothetical protein